MDETKNRLTKMSSPTCMVTKMRAFPIYGSLSNIKYGIFECISFDIIEFGQRTRSIDGYRYVALYVDHCNNKSMVYGMKHKDKRASIDSQVTSSSIWTN